MRSLVLSALLAVIVAPLAHAAVPEDRFSALHWRLIGPFRGGRALAVSGVPGQPDHFYFGSVNGGVWETIDDGRTWSPIFDTVPNGSVGALAVAPSDPRVLYVGTGEADMRSDIAQGVGVFKSVDAGHSWRFSGLADSQAIAKILVDPRNPNVVLAAVLGHPYGPNPQRGVFRSADGGQTWSRVLFRDNDTGAIDLTFEPGRPDVVYAALWGTRRPPWNTYPPSTGPGGGVFKSTDGGLTWRELKGLPEHPGRIGLAVAQTAPQRVYALVDAAKGGGLYRSDNGGDDWIKVSGDRRIWERGWYFGGISVDPANPDRVWICDVDVYQSDDGGHNFVPVKGAPGGDDYHSLWIDPQRSERRILGSDQGTVITVDGGATWSSWFNQPTGQFYHVTTDNSFPYRVFGSQQDSGAAFVPSRTGSIDGINLRDFREIAAGGESDNLAPDPQDPDIVFGGRVDKLDLKTGQTRSVDPTLASSERSRSTWTLPLTFSKRDPKALYFANQRVFVTRDGGDHWNPISPDLTRPNPAVPATLDSATRDDHSESGARRGVVYSIAPSPIADGLTWAGTDDGLVWKTADGGKNWIDVTPKGLGAWSKVGVVEASRFDPQTAYLAIDRHRLDDFRPYVYRTHDGGRSWTLVANGLTAADSPRNSVNVVREDSHRRGLLYAGTERGVFVSFDDGGAWQPLGRDLPATSVRDIDVHGDDLVIATHGRAFWIMDDVAPLRQLSPSLPKAAQLFTPAAAVRVRPFGFTGSPMPKDEPRAANPPDGAYIDYWLPKTTKGRVVITVRDAKGGVVRRFASDDRRPPADPAALRVTPDWVAAPQAPGDTPGMHRFIWNLHYSLPDNEGVPGEERDPGVWAPPGDYQVELVADGATLREPLIVRSDPRLNLRPEAYSEQFELAASIEKDVARGRAAMARAAALQKALASAAAKSDAADASALQSLSRRAAELAARPDGEGPPGAEGFGPVIARLAQLYRAVDGADAAPSADARAGYVAASGELNRLVGVLDELEAQAKSRLHSA